MATRPRTALRSFTARHPRTAPHPFTVLALGASAVLLATAAGSAPAVGLLVLVCAALALRHRAFRAWCTGSLVVLVPLWISQLMVHALADPRGGTVLVQWGWLRVTREGLGTAAEYGLRVVPLVCVGVLCLLVVDRMSLLAAVDESRAPRALGYVAATTLSLLPQLRARSRAVTEAQAVRGVDQGRPPLSWLRILFRQAVPLVTTAVDDSSQRAAHLQARGFPGEAGRIQRYREVPDSPAQKALRRTVLAASAAGAVVLWVL